jgi:hypothetical protein
MLYVPKPQQIESATAREPVKRSSLLPAVTTLQVRKGASAVVGRSHGFRQLRLRSSRAALLTAHATPCVLLSPAPENDRFSVREGRRARDRL